MVMGPAPFTEQIEGRYGAIRFFSKDTVIGAALRLYGEWAENELRCFRPFIPAGGTVLDVGAFIGTHTLAFSWMVGPEGVVLSFEPQIRSFALLEENVRTNRRDNVRLYHAAVGAEPRRMQLDPMDIRDSINFGGLTVHDAEGGEAKGDEVEMVTIDGLGLDRCDFIKLDIEGSEDVALNGATTTITLLKPVIYAESNTLADAARSFALLHSFGYTLFLHVVDAFNPRNFAHAEHNIFGPAREAGLIAIPPGRRGEIIRLTDPSWRLFELQTLDDLVFGMLQKPQYFDEVLRVGAAAKAGGAVVSAVENQNLRESFGHTRQELDALRETLQHEVVRTLVAVSSEAARNKTELAETRDTLEAARAKLEARNRELGETHDALEATRVKLEARDRELGETHDALEATRAKLEARDCELGETHDALEATRAKLEARDREIGETHDALEATRAKLEARDRELGETHNALEATRAKLEARDRELGETHDALEATRAKLEARDRELGETQDAFEATRGALAIIKKSNFFKIVTPAIKSEIALRDRTRTLRRMLKPGRKNSRGADRNIQRD